MTLFPETVGDMMNESILGRAQERGFIRIDAHQIRDFPQLQQQASLVDAAGRAVPGLVPDVKCLAAGQAFRLHPLGQQLDLAAYAVGVDNLTGGNK